MSGVGYLGELEVINHFKKILGHEIYVPLKDKGIDFLTTKNNTFYQIQVKTSTLQLGKRFWFDISKSKMVYTKNTYYVFVCKSLGRRTFMGKKYNFLVVPSLDIKKWIAKKKILPKGSNKDVYSLLIFPDVDKKKWIHRNLKKELNLTKYWKKRNI
jgi:hypothetical protein